MNQNETKLIGILNEWQDQNDLRPSEMARSLLRMVAYFSPTASKDALQPALDAAFDALVSPSEQRKE